MYQLIVVGGLQCTFPNVETLLRIFLIIPISNATGERSFSVLKRIKNYLRNSISQCKLGDLSILCIESKETLEYDFNAHIDSFAKLKSRKKVI
ncbi:hypothetical protein HELRODRAFT_68916 [Helobdella robusta]|uniref:HAT C-terminal dimerisation domain-containing protein n=1 Tax=Helobdella robusta TaxID=6412 RepID=T1FZL2_HELRO|nr:hypothetical protein HELRODRAFT_68916 [Helobdella robusta]ESN94529.1 hypothetical protein HELRODRAFT_68916 [Helobdella robusta]